MSEEQAADAVAELDQLDQMIEDAINEEPAPQEDETPEVEKPKAKTGEEDSNIQKRFNKITADKWDAINRAKQLEEENERLKQQQVVKPQVDGKPTLEQFDYDDEQYQEALIDWKVNQKAAEITQQQQEQLKKQEQSQVISDFNARALEFAKGKTDFNDALAAIPTLNPLVLDSLMAMDNGPEVAYFLGNHLDVADQLASLNPVNGGIKLGELSHKLRSSKPKISNAPDPIEPVTGGAAIETSIDAEIPIEEWMSKFN